jgi:ribosomal protein S18 acetylase RimI-like enzyme
MVTHCKIRPAAAADMDRIVELIAELDLYHQPLEPDFVRQGAPTPAKKERFRSFLDNDAFVILVADSAGSSIESIAGFVRMQIDDRKENRVFKACRVGTVHELAVTGEGRRRGIGKALMEAAHVAARGRGVQYVELSHFASNVSTGRFYDDLGYRPFLRHLVFELK